MQLIITNYISSLSNEKGEKSIVLNKLSILNEFDHNKHASHFHGILESTHNKKLFILPLFLFFQQWPENVLLHHLMLPRL